jgi:hypothetical protein
VAVTVAVWLMADDGSGTDGSGTGGSGTGGTVTVWQCGSVAQMTAVWQWQCGSVADDDTDGSGT